MAVVVHNERRELPTSTQVITVHSRYLDWHDAAALIWKPNTRFDVASDEVLLWVTPLDDPSQLFIPAIVCTRFVTLLYYSFLEANLEYVYVHIIGKSWAGPVLPVTSIQPCVTNGSARKTVHTTRKKGCSNRSS